MEGGTDGGRDGWREGRMEGGREGGEGRGGEHAMTRTRVRQAFSPSWTQAVILFHSMLNSSGT
jgi:hypothetical protein